MLISFPIFGQENSLAHYYISSYTFANLGEEVGDLFIDPEIEGRLLATTWWYSNEGVKISIDDGETWYPSLINTSYSTQSIRANSIAFNPSNLEVGYLAARLGLFKTMDRGETWDSTNMFPYWYNDINYVVYHPLDSNIVFLSNSGHMYNPVYLYKSLNGGVNWKISDSTNFDKLIFHPDSIDIMYGISVQHTIKKTTNGGETWEKINNNLVASYVITALEQSRINPNTLYCGQYYDYSSDTWLLSMTKDGGDSWVRIDSTLKEINPRGIVYSIFLDQNREGRFYISYTGGLFLTEDNGKHYQNIYSGTTGKIWSDNKNPPNIYFNSDRGLLRILDTLTVGVKIFENNIPTQYKLNQNYPNPFNPTTVISYSIPNRENVSIKIFDTLGKEIETLVNEIQLPGEYELEFDASKLSSGIYFYSSTTASYFKVKKMILLR